jgi:hypothetical protein
VDAWAPIPGLDPPPGAQDSLSIIPQRPNPNFPSEMFPEIPPELRFAR